MVLHLAHISCTVCERHIGEMRDVMHLDETEEGVRINGAYHYGFHPLPPARYRDKIAPDLCDKCWKDYQIQMTRRQWRRGRSCPPFRSIYLWAWVAERLKDQARRLSPHYQNKAKQGNMTIDRINGYMR